MNYPYVIQCSRPASGATQDPARGRLTTAGEVLLHEGRADVQHSVRRRAQDTEGRGTRVEQWTIFFEEEEAIRLLRSEDTITFTRDPDSDNWTRGHVISADELEGSIEVEVRR